MNGTDATVSEGRAAWQRIKTTARTSWNDWVLIGKALIAGRSEAMKAAKINRPFGATYVRIFGAFLREHGFDGIDTQQRYRAIVCIENLQAIEEFRAKLDEKKRNAWNHPGAVWAHWRRSLKPATPAPRRQRLVERVTAAADAARGGKPVYWSQAALRRAHEAMLKSKSTDLLILARAALESAIRSEADLIELLPPNTVNMSALPRRTDVVSAAGYVG